MPATSARVMKPSGDKVVVKPKMIKPKLPKKKDE
jgi:hypothetical protein